MTTSRDLTQYRFNDQTIGKGRLVLALVRQYLEDNPGAAFNDLRGAFPDALQADSPIQFSTEQCVVAQLKDLSNAAQGRYFVGDGEQIPLSDGVTVVCREWNQHNIMNMLEVAQKLGYKVAVIRKDPAP